MIGSPTKVSIIVPIYNVEEYLSACLHSCVSQTLYDIDIICVNDGSTDGSVRIAEAFAARDRRIQIVNKPNGGLASARNAGIEAACGEMIMFLDGDDYLQEQACERVWRETLEAPTDVVIFGTRIFPEKPRASSWHYDVLHVRTRRYEHFTPAVLFREPAAKPFVWRQAFNRKFFQEYGLRFDERVGYGEDTVFQMEAFPHGKTFSFIEDRLYNYRWYREGSLMDGFRYDLDARIRKHLSFVELITAYWKEQGWLELYGKDYVSWLMEFLVVDSCSPDAKHTDEHLRQVNALLDRYDLRQYLNKVYPAFRTQAGIVKRAAK